LLANLKCILWLLKTLASNCSRFVGCQYQLRSLLIFALLLAAGVAWFARERHECARHLALAQQLEQFGCRVTLGRKFCTPTLVDCRTGTDSSWRRWWGHLCGERIVHVTMDANNADYAFELLEGFTLELATIIVRMEADPASDYELDF
jgi:hypothetical protein